MHDNTHRPHSDEMEDHLDLLRGISNWWLGRIKQPPTADLNELVEAMNAAAREIEAARKQASNRLTPARKEHKRHNQATVLLVESMLKQVDTSIQITRKQRGKLQEELLQVMDEYTHNTNTHPTSRSIM